MWWRILLSNLKLISAVGSSFAAESTHLPLSTRASSISAYSSLFARQFGSAAAETAVKKKRVEDVMPIATGHEKEELEAQLQGRKLLGIDFPEGPFGTKEAPAIVKSYYHMRIVGCPGGEAAKRDISFERQRMSMTLSGFGWRKLHVVGPGGPPDGHGDHHH